MQNLYKLQNLKTYLFIFVLLNLMISSVFAAAPDDVIGTKLCAFIKLLQGNVAKSVAIVAIMTVALGLFTGKTSWPVALTVAVGIVIMFSAPGVVNMISGSDSGTDACAGT